MHNKLLPVRTLDASIWYLVSSYCDSATATCTYMYLLGTLLSAFSFQRHFTLHLFITITSSEILFLKFYYEYTLGNQCQDNTLLLQAAGIAVSVDGE